jgi:hypothetical protein
MSASEEPKEEAERVQEEEKARWHGGQPSERAREVPLFLKDSSDGRKGNAQDEKDETGE